METPLQRHARACRGHPRLSCELSARKTWMAATSPAMTPNRWLDVMGMRSSRAIEGVTMAEEIRDCLPPDRNPRRPTLAPPKGAIDTHVHVFAPPYKLSPGRGYNPPPSTLADLKQLHAMLGIDRVVFTQPSVYGIDNSAILAGMAALNAESPNRPRAVAAFTLDIGDGEVAVLDAGGVRGVRLNKDNAGGMPITIGAIPDLAARIAPLRWHIEFLFPGKDIIELMPTLAAVTVPISIAHFAYQPATAGVSAPGFSALIQLIPPANTSP